MSWTKARSQIANNSKLLGPDHPETIKSKVDLRAERLAAHVAKVVAEFPPLTDEQRERIAALLRVGAAA